MINEKLIPSLIIEEDDFLPKRGGKYVSEQKKNEEKLAKIREKLSSCNCDCNCNCDCDDSCDCNC